MAGIYGTTQAYQGVADTFLGLAPSCGDKLFGSEIDYCDLVQWGVYAGQENDPRVLQNYLANRQHIQKSVSRDYYSLGAEEPNKRKSTTKVSVVDVLEQIPQLSEFAKVCRESGWDHYLSDTYFETQHLRKFTVFAPNNEAWRNKGWDLNYTSLLKQPYARQNELRVIAKAHTLPFGLEQDQMLQRKLKLITSLETFNIYVDGTGEVRPNLNLYQPPDEMLNLQYPPPLKRINILRTWYTNNGVVYEIDDVLRPTVVI